MSSNRLVIFSKSAETGLVKTRLRKILSEEQCLSLHVAMLQDTLLKVQKHSPVLYLSGSGFLSFETTFPICMQTGIDLGERLSNAFNRELQDHNKVIVIGTDSPMFPEEQIGNAFRLLDSHDAVLGPSEDGGYYLIGLRRPIPEIFHSIEWGTSTVLAETLKRIGNYSYALLETCYDIDTPEDLNRLKASAISAQELPHLRKWFNSQ